MKVVGRWKTTLALPLAVWFLLLDFSAQLRLAGMSRVEY
jgi:hypothetical protein